MRCKKHLADLSSGVGICATCLRERLFAVMAAQAQKEAQLHQAQRLDRRKSDTQLQPAFPRSVSPYVSRRKSTNSAATSRVHGHGCDPRFYSTPQVGANGSVAVEKKKKKSNGGTFSKLFMGIFRSKSREREVDSVSVSGISSEYSCRGSPSWFSTMIPGRRRKQIRTFSLDEGAIASHRRAYGNGERGMSPARYSERDENAEHCHGGSSGYSSESSQGRKHTPRMTPARRGGGVVRGISHSRNVSGLAFCLSPLVRASPNRHWNPIGAPAPDMAVVGESRGHPHSHLSSTTPAMYKNRSRKLADFGRHSYNSLH